MLKTSDSHLHLGEAVRAERERLEANNLTQISGSDFAQCKTLQDL